MKVRSYPGRAVLEDPELLLDPDATRGRAMELLYEASWRECGVNWTNSSRTQKSHSSSTSNPSKEQTAGNNKPYADVITQLEGVLEGGSSTSTSDDRSPKSSNGTTSTDSDEGSLRTVLDGRRKDQQIEHQQTNQSGFLIPRPRLIVPVHTYARRRRTGAPQPARRRQREGRKSREKKTSFPFFHSLGTFFNFDYKCFDIERQSWLLSRILMNFESIVSPPVTNRSIVFSYMRESIRWSNHFIKK